MTRNAAVNSTVPATKPQPVVVLGAAIAAASTVVSGLTILLKDNPTAILVLGIAGVLVSGAAVFKDQVVKSQVVPVDDVAAFVNEDRQLVTGPASVQPDGLEVRDIRVQDEGQTYHADEYDPRHDDDEAAAKLDWP